jgi:hypothetical protein
MLLRSSPLLSDALVVGADRPEFGVLLFPQSLPAPTDLVAQLSPLIAQANQSSPSFAQVAEEMCLVVTDAQKAACLPKSSKGTIQRGLAYDVFQAEIERVYDEGSSEGTEASASGDREACHVTDQDDRSHGEESRTAGPHGRPVQLGSQLPHGDQSEIRDAEGEFHPQCFLVIQASNNTLQQLNTGGNPLPANIVFEHPTIAQ